MADNIGVDWVEVFAAAARVELDADAAARVARAVTPTAARFAAPDIVIPFEVEPSTFVVVQRREARP